ncbi:MAG: hypothetical protein HKM24_02185 [Gammaproteobacteria bacterium]|nr:hypothetical protein [Gammaproteobacteria bacterium]
MFSASNLPIIGRWLERAGIARTPERTDHVGIEELVTAKTMAMTFPQVKHLAINMSIRAPDNEIEPTMNGRSFSPDSIACFSFRCKNVECVHGGFDLQEEIERAIAEQQTEITGRRVCRGWRNKRLIEQQRCYYELNFKIHITYYN